MRSMRMYLRGAISARGWGLSSSAYFSSLPFPVPFDWLSPRVCRFDAAFSADDLCHGSDVGLGIGYRALLNQVAR